MKKLILAVALLAGMTFVACSSDDDKGNSNSNCVNCTISFQGQTETEEVCEGENGNAFVDGEDMEMTYDEYIELVEMLGDCN